MNDDWKEELSTTLTALGEQNGREDIWSLLFCEENLFYFKSPTPCFKGGLAYIFIIFNSAIMVHLWHPGSNQLTWRLNQ